MRLILALFCQTLLMGQMGEVVNRYTEDVASLERYYPQRLSKTRMAKLSAVYEKALDGVDFDKLDQAGRVDYILLKRQIEYRLRGIEQQKKRMAEMAPLVPFAERIVQLAEARQRVDPVEGFRGNQGST